jgi:type IV pilus assembly protein PilN
LKITLNLATRPYADQGPAIKRLRIGMLVLAVLLLGLGFGLLHFHQSAMAMRAQEERQDLAIARIRQEQLGYQRQMQQPANAKVLQQAEFLNRLFDEKAFSWTAAMEDLERVLPLGVQVTAIEPVRAKDGRLTLRLRISGLRERSVEMVRNMERSPRFGSPRISGENEDTSAQNGPPGVQPVRDAKRVSFDLLAEYNPATLEERKAELRHPAAKAALKAGAPVTVPVRPGYVAPNVLPGVPPGMSPGVRPGGGPRRMPGPGGQPQFQPQYQPQNEPSGFDPNGLSNHDRNRIPPPNAQPNPGGAE